MFRDPSDDWESESESSDEEEQPPLAKPKKVPKYSGVSNHYCTLYSPQATKKATKVDIDLSMSAFSNARR